MLETLISGGGNFVQIFSHFSLQFGEIVFWRGRKENLWAPPLFSPPPPLNQTVENVIFLHIFHPLCFHPNQTYLKSPLAQLSLFDISNIISLSLSLSLYIYTLFNIDFLIYIYIYTLFNIDFLIFFNHFDYK